MRERTTGSGQEGGQRAEKEGPVIAKARSSPEHALQNRICVALTDAGVRVLQHRIFPCYNCGAKPSKAIGLGEFAADILCIVPPHGRACFVEVKLPRTKHAKRDEGQRAWARYMRMYGAIAGVATSPEEALALIEEARK